MTMIDLPESTIKAAAEYAASHGRSTSEQITLWAKASKAAQDNPDLPFEFIQGILEAMEEDDFSPFEFSAEFLETLNGNQ